MFVSTRLMSPQWWGSADYSQDLNQDINGFSKQWYAALSGPNYWFSEQKATNTKRCFAFSETRPEQFWQFRELGKEWFWWYLCQRRSGVEMSLKLLGMMSQRRSNVFNWTQWLLKSRVNFNGIYAVFVEALFHTMYDTSHLKILSF